MNQTNPPVTEEAVERVIRDILSEHLPHGTDFDAAAVAIAALTKSPPVVSEAHRADLRAVLKICEDGDTGTAQRIYRFVAQRLAALAMSVESEATQGGQ